MDNSKIYSIVVRRGVRIPKEEAIGFLGDLSKYDVSVQLGELITSYIIKFRLTDNQLASLKMIAKYEIEILQTDERSSLFKGLNRMVSVHKLDQKTVYAEIIKTVSIILGYAD